MILFHFISDARCPYLCIWNFIQIPINYCISRSITRGKNTSACVLWTVICVFLSDVNKVVSRRTSQPRRVRTTLGRLELCCLWTAGPDWHFYGAAAGVYLCVRTVAPRNDWRAIPPPLDRSLSHVHTPAPFFLSFILRHPSW